jgi:peptidoglycan/LPS O-acetylase OafA/YrhL
MNPDPPPFHLGYRRSLDGIRGVAILFVVLVHDGIIRDTFGFIGINTFFVLSGFLITCLLVEEWDMSNDIRFREFYVRRALRLLPALLIMLIAFVVFAFFFDPRRKAIREFYEALRALFYFTNWARIFRIGRTVTLVHTWSLSVEEQFYFTWPFILYCAKPRALHWRAGFFSALSFRRSSVSGCLSEAPKASAETCLPGSTWSACTPGPIPGPIPFCWDVFPACWFHRTFCRDSGGLQAF